MYVLINVDAHMKSFCSIIIKRQIIIIAPEVQIVYLISSFSVAADQNKYIRTHIHMNVYTQLGICIENQETVPTTPKCEKQTKTRANNERRLPTQSDLCMRCRVE